MTDETDSVVAEIKKERSVILSFFIMIVILVILCAGEPDLLDAIVHRVMECK